MFFNIKQITAPELASWRQDERNSLRIIDVREMREINAGTIAGAEALPLATLPFRSHDINRDDTVVFICRSGARSAQACAFLQQHGYENVHNLHGGMIAWTATGFPATLPRTA